MRYLTADECAAWCAGHAIELGAGAMPERYPANVGGAVRFALSAMPGQLTWLSRFISESLKPRHECLLWIKDFGIFPSSENLHLYYRLRQSYGDARLLREAMGHLFLEYEDADLASFVQLGIVNGWDMYLFPQLAYGEADTARVVICHDEWFCLHHKQEFALKQWRESLENAQYRLMP